MGHCYLTVAVHRMRIPALRRFTKTYRPVVQFSASWLMGGDHRDTHAHTVAIPETLADLAPTSAQDIILSRQVLLEAVPYTGGEFHLWIALLAVEANDLGRGLIDVLGKVAKIPGAGPVAAAQPFFEPVKAAFEFLTNTDEAASIAIGVMNDWATPTAGVYLALRATRTQLDPDRLALADDWSLLLDDRPVTDHAYVVFTLERGGDRARWHSDHTRRLATEVEGAIDDGEIERVVVAWQHLMVSVFRSEELIHSNARTRLRMLHSEFSDEMAARGLDATRLPEPPSEVDHPTPRAFLRRPDVATALERDTDESIVHRLEAPVSAV